MKSHAITPVEIFRTPDNITHATEEDAFQHLENQVDKAFQELFNHTLAQPIHPGDKIRIVQWVIINRARLSDLLNF